MSSQNTKIILFSFLVMLVMTLTMCSSNKNDEESLESVQSCSKDDQICKDAAKGKDATKSGETAANEAIGDDTNKAKGSDAKQKNDKSDVKSDESKPAKKSSKKKSKSKSDSDIADCPLCSYTRPLVKRIMEWIRELLTDPMLIMVYEFVKEKVWELGKMSKQAFGVRLF